jgi:hypothetical protein
MLLSLMVVAGAAQLGVVPYVGTHDPNRPIASRAPYPAAVADDVRRPGFNGRVWVSRPIIGSMQQGPFPVGWGSPGPEAYGGFDNQDAEVYARVGHQVVGINPWESINSDGLKRFEAARNFWLQEQGYTGGVRTFINDLYLWKQAESQPTEEHASAVPPTPMPRATITLPADMPPQRRRIRVDAGHAQPVVCPGVGPARVSWPLTAPADAVARTSANGGLLGGPEPSRVITSAK